MHLAPRATGHLEHQLSTASYSAPPAARMASSLRAPLRPSRITNSDDINTPTAAHGFITVTINAPTAAYGSSTIDAPAAALGATTAATPLPPLSPSIK
jgi:hypothetical protein